MILETIMERGVMLNIVQRGREEKRTIDYRRG